MSIELAVISMKQYQKLSYLLSKFCIYCLLKQTNELLVPFQLFWRVL